MDLFRQAPKCRSQALLYYWMVERHLQHLEDGQPPAECLDASVAAGEDSEGKKAEKDAFDHGNGRGQSRVRSSPRGIRRAWRELSRGRGNSAPGFESIGSIPVEHSAIT